MTDFTAFSTRSMYAAEINAGYSARLNGAGLSTNPHMVWMDTQDELEPRKVKPLGDKALAWQHGWRAADRDEKGRGGAR
ncbi:hypothetical protein [Stenotrophomonas sp. TWI602]|uniref:hypothetical protein n=1 Tax=Stenotrophomonas sp. TWI602 TaxID=3136786 RepID=UPI000FAF8076